MSAPAHPARVWLYLAASTLSSGVLASLRPLYASRFMTMGVDAANAGMLIGAVQSLSFLAAPVIGLLIDKAVGVRRAGVAGLSMLTAGAAMAALPFEATAFASLALVSFGELFARVALLVMIADCYPAGSPRRASAFLLRHVGLNFSFFGLPALSSMLFMSTKMIAPAVMCALIGVGATVVLASSPEEDESVPAPVKTGVLPLAIFTLLGLSTAAVNVLMDRFTSAGLVVDPSNPAAIGARAFLQLLNPVVVVAVGIPVAIMWTSAKPGSVGRITVALAAFAFVGCTVEGLIARLSVGTDAPVGLAIAAANAVGALVEVLAWPLSTALVSSVAPPRYRATWMGTWAAAAGLPYALPNPGLNAAGSATAGLVTAFATATFIIAALLFAARGRIAAWINTFVDPAHS